MGYYQALEQGYYKDAGFDVEFIEGHEKTSAAKDVLEGKAEFGISSTRALYYYLNGNDLTLVSTIFQYNPLVLLSRNPSIHSLRDFENKAIMLYSKESGATSILSMLSNDGVKLNSIDQIPYDYKKLYKLKEEKIDGFELHLTEVPRFQKLYSNQLKVFNPLSYGSSEYGDLIFTTKSFAVRYPDQVKRFKDASIKGWKYALSHAKESIQLVRSKYKVQLSEQDLYEEHEIIRSLIQDRLIPVGYSNKKRWDKFAQSFYDLGVIKKPKRKLKEFFDPSTEQDVYAYDAILLIVILGLLFILLKQLYEYICTTLKARSLLKQELNIASDHLSSLQSFASIGTWNYVTETDTLFFSQGFFKMLKRDASSGQLSFRESLKYIHPDDQERFVRAFKELCDFGYAFELSIKVVREDNVVRYFATSGYVDQWFDKKVAKVQGEVQDITEFIEQRNKLGLTRYSIDSSSELMIWLNREGSIIDLNEAVCEVFEVNRESLIGKLLSEIYPSLSYETLKNNLAFIYELGFLKREVDFVVSKELVTFELLANSVNFQNNDYVFISLRNMSMRKKHEDELLQAKKQAEAAEHLKRNLIATLSHEFHVPMNRIVELGSQLAQSDLKQQDTIVSQIENYSADLLSLLSETLIYSSISTSDEKYSNVDIQEMLDIACLEMHESIKDSQLQLYFKCDGLVPKVVYIDVELLQLLVKNLLDNAITNSSDGDIEVNLSFVDQVDTFGLPYLVLTVKDQGCGISEYNQSRIFQPFYQVLESGDKGGTGMGLAVCEKIVEAFSGNISVRSTINDGSEFVCLIPISKFTF